MYTEELFQTQREWSEKGLSLLRELLPLMTPVAQYAGWTEEERQTIGLLLSATARSSESVMLLAAYGQLWDAEPVLRSVFEGSLKFAFLLESEQEFSQRYKEYTEDLFFVALLKDHQKAKDLLSVIPNSESPEWKPIRDRVLPDSEWQDLSQRYSSATRSTLERKWGYNALLRARNRSGEPLWPRFPGLAFGYSTASHLQHADFIGVWMPMEREWRSAERRDAIHLAHLARLISDTVACLHIRLAAGYKFTHHDPSSLNQALSNWEALEKSFGGIYDKWMDVEYGPTRQPNDGGDE